MSPHAIAPNDGDLQQWTLTHNGNGHTNGHAQNSCLTRYADEEVHDLVCVGFGPASLAIALALNDALEDGVPNLRTDQPKVRFLEKQKSFAWHAGMLLPGAKMQITFIKDMATLRNPRSRFTFINYLHEKNRLVQFSNLGTFLPQRIEYEDYMRWCASHFEEVVDYGRDVQSVTPGHVNPETGVVEHFLVKSKNWKSGSATTLRARHVVIAAGGRPNIPACLPANHPRIIHSSQYATSAEQRFAPGEHPQSIVVIGAGQSAAEVFNNIPSRFPGAKAHLVIRSSALRPSDDSPFVNEVFDPSRVDDVYSQDPVIRSEQLARDKATNYAVVRLELLEHIYNNLYSSRIRFGDDEEQWPQRIHNHREILGVSDTEVDGRPAVNVHIKNNSSAYSARKHAETETLTVDLIVVASGYRRDAHEDMLQGLRDYMPGGEDEGKRWNVRRDYGVDFKRGAIAQDAGVWLQGCNEKTHGLSDSLLSILACRGGEMVESIFGAH
ncbi:putative L-ornithine 5-monooxygenase [Teratosphaeria nubilosa]|uniref:L-ornithine N(5)-monooxygenase [NAD(P)H] n=1 Tax=Teratosphaeria nubilosa TaxID=161662 RepID=A0A6G1KV29_9PEZI|nr:putative L-ornithine 5-monooxygenase [Teratosphaeria nubilosa]